MTNITLSIREDIYKKMKKHSEIKWSEFVRKEIENKINELENNSKKKLLKEEIMIYNKKDSYEELLFYKKLVENSLEEEINEKELKIILEARKSKILSEEEFIELNPDLKDV